MHVNAPSGRTLEESEDGDHHVYTNTYPYDNLSEDGHNHNRQGSSILSGGEAAPSPTSKRFTIITVVFTFMLFIVSMIGMASASQLRKSVSNVGFTCGVINVMGAGVLGASIVLFILSLIVLILSAVGTLGKFHAKAFDSREGSCCCTGKKICVFVNIFLLALFTALLLVGSLLSFSFYRLSTQAADATARTFQGQDGEIFLTRDQYGLPRVHASTKRDAMFGQGYAQAQDRLWELEFTRLVVQGRLAEFLGKAALKMDKQTRNLGFRRAAEDMCSATTNVSKGLFQSFVNGINHYLATTTERPVEFAFMGKPPVSIVPQMRLFGMYEPEPFDINLVCYAAKLIQWEMAGDAQSEASRFKIWWMNPDVSMDNVSQIFSNYTNVSHTILTSAQLGISGQDVIDRQRQKYNTFMTEASNYLKIFDPVRQNYMTSSPSGGFSSTSNHFQQQQEKANKKNKNNKVKPFTNIFEFKSRFASNGWTARDANKNAAGGSDPHLTITLPSVWHQIHLQWGGTQTNPSFAVTGVALAAMCGIGIGKRLDVFWSITAGQTDTEDLFVLNQTSPDSDTYFVQKDPSNPNGEFVALTLTTRTEVIKVLGEDDVVLNIKESIYGSDVTDVFFETASADADTDDDDDSTDQFVWSNMPNKDPSKAPFRFHMYSPVLRPDNSSADAFANTLDENSQNAVDFRQKVCSQLASPAFSITIGDSNGGISYSLTGDHQERLADHWGRWPHFANQNEGAYYKQQIIPFDEKPGRVIDIAFTADSVATANQKIYPDGYKYDLGDSYDPGYRGMRIQNLIAQADPSTLGDLTTHRTFQSDHYSGMWLYAIKPFVTRFNNTFAMPLSRVADATYGPLSADQQQAWKNAQFWITRAGVGNGNFDGLANVGTTAISFLWKWIQEYSSIAAPLTQQVTNSKWWDDFLFIDKSVNGQAPTYVQEVLCKQYLVKANWFQIQNRNGFFMTSDLCAQAFIVAFLKMATEYPTDANYLRWAQDIKPFKAQNRMMTTTSLGCMFDRHVEKDGDTTSLDVSDFSLQSATLTSKAASSMRNVYSFKIGQSSYMYFALPGGASGYPYDWRYTNLLEMWRTEQYITLQTEQLN